MPRPMLISQGVRTSKSLRSRLVVVALLLLALPSLARAQSSSIGGAVRDTSGGVLPGVTVTVSSPTLIEGAKETTTDGAGLYRVPDLRPGTYTVKFVLPGFTTVERTEIEIQGDFNARIDVELSVGGLAETLTVSGQSPMVDVQSATKVNVLDRDTIDNVPTGKTIPGLGQLILGVSLSAPDVGGNAGAENTYMSMRGGAVGARNNSYLVDGLNISSLQTVVQPYTNEGNYEEVSYSTANKGAESSNGGVSVNLIPKEGGNRFSGSTSWAIRPGALQGDNYTDRLQLWGIPRDVQGNPVVNRIHHIWDMNATEGGPLKRERLWFFISGRNFEPVNTVPNTFLDDGTQGIDDNFVRNANVRLTLLLSSRQRVGAFYERVWKDRGHLGLGAFEDPETSTFLRTSPNYSTASIKYTGTFGARLLIEGGFSQNVEFYANAFQPGVEFDRWTPGWYAGAAHVAAGAGAAVSPDPTQNIRFSHPFSKYYSGSVSYVTGSHHAKAGMSLRHGTWAQGTWSNADLSQNYPTSVRGADLNNVFPTTVLFDSNPTLFASLFPTLRNGSPCAPTTGTSTCSVTVLNLPIDHQSQTLNYDLGVFVQDSYTLKRLTLNAGIRWEAFNAQIDAGYLQAGRFVPSRQTPERNDLPNWRDWAPRFQSIFDVFGNAKTALRFSINRYNESETVQTATSLDPRTRVTSVRNWTDLNRDDIAQGQRTFNPDGTYTDCVYLTPGCEINLSGTPTQPALSATFGGLGDPGVYNGAPRVYRIEEGIELQHELLPRLSLTGAYYHGELKNRTKTVNRGRTDNGTLGTQYRPVTLYNPIDGTPFTYYNLLVTLPVDNVTYMEPNIKTTYDTYVADIALRPFRGAQLTGGIELTRVLTTDCSTSLTRADGSPAVVDPNSIRFCDQTHLSDTLDGPVIYKKPFQENFKLNGAFPVGWGLIAGFSYQNLFSGTLSPTFRYGTAFTYPTGQTNNILANSATFPACPTTFGCVPGGVTVPANWVGAAACTVIGNLIPAGLIADERITQLDLRVSKRLKVGSLTVQPAIEAFNVMNEDNIRSRLSQEIAGSQGLYLTPLNLLQGRIIGFSALLRW